MMLPVLSSESFGYHHMQFPAVIPVLVDGSKKNTRDFAVIRDIIWSIWSDDSKFLHVMVYKSQVASFESPS